MSINDYIDIDYIDIDVEISSLFCIVREVHIIDSENLYDTCNTAILEFFVFLDLAILVLFKFA